MRAADSLFQFMPYGAPELKEVAKKYMFRGVMVGSAAWLVLFLLSFGTSAFLRNRPHETKVVVVPYRELAAPPPLTDKAPPPQVAIAQPVAPPSVAIPVPVPDAEAPPEQVIASQEELSQSTSSVATEGDNQLVVAPPDDDALPKFGDYVYVEELPEVISKPAPEYPDLARSAGVDGVVQLQALVGKDGKVKDVRVMKGVEMLNEAALKAVRNWVFKPALSNNKPVAVWVAVPVRFSLN